MRETDTPIIDMLTLRRDVYLLASLLLADKKMASIRNVSDWSRDLYENEVNRFMLLVAAVSRGLLDLSDKSDVENHSCGEYWPEFRKNKESLTFRQACNSVIHAKEILPYKVKYKAMIRQAYYVDRITVRGKHKGKTTRAQIDIIKFVGITGDLINSFEEGDHANK